MLRKKLDKKLISKLQKYILKFKGNSYDPTIQDWSDYETIKMFGTEFIEKYHTIINKIVTEFDNNDIEYALFLFENFMRPTDNSIKAYYDTYVKDMDYE